MKLIRLLLLGLCLVQGTAHAQSGAQTAALLNARYNSTPSQCVARAPAFNCSGILLRTVADNQSQAFWTRGADNPTLRFVFLRKDRAATSLNTTFGYVLFDRLSAVAQGKPYQGTAAPSEVSVDSWNAQAPDSLPIQGLFYEVSKGRGLLGAQGSQLTYFKATGVWLPVLRLQLDDPRGQVFGFSQQDQLFEGFRVAQRLNLRYANTGTGADACRNNSASFNCRGVLLRTTDVGNFRAWDPSPGGVRGNGVSFSYFRADTQVLRTYKPQGFVVRELAAPAVQPMSMRCVYPFDAHTGGSADLCNFRPACSAQKVTSVPAWMAAYGTQSITSCAFSTSAQDVHLANDVRLRGTDPYGWNELIMAAWPSGMPGRLPLEAFVYSLKTHVAGDGLSGGRRFQLDYNNDTGRTLPLLQVHPMPVAQQLFSYRPEEQAVQ